MDWLKFEQTTDWEVLFPYPDFKPRRENRGGTAIGFPPYTPEESIRQQKIEWRTQALAFIGEVKQKLKDQRSEINQHMRKGLRQHELRLRHLVDLDANKLADKWLASLKNYSVNSLYYLYISVKRIYAFVAEEVQLYQAMMSGITESTNPELADSQHKREEKTGFTQRQVALLYAYRGNKIWPTNSESIAEQYGHRSGHRLQQEYNRVRDSANRIGRGGESERVINAFVKDIKAVIPHLTSNQAQQAHNEITTILAKIS